MGACVEPYPPPSAVDNASFLVVDGFLNATTESVSVKINHSVALNSSSPYPAEKGATVTIEDNNGESISLTEGDNGLYQASEFPVDPAKTYKLHIVTSAGTSYSSDYVELRHVPEIDSVVWRPETTTSEPGTRFYVNTHDPTNSTSYYRFLFTETWEYRVEFVSDFKRDGVIPVYRPPSEQVYTCWRTINSTAILTTSTKHLNTDVVSMYPIRFINRGSRMLSRLYSINVEQRAVSQEEYEYWNLVKKTTENLGGLFDPLPSQVTGNVHNDNDPGEQVLGYFSGGYTTTKRTFLAYSDLPGPLMTVDPWDFVCEVKTIPITNFDLVGDLVYLQSQGIPPTAYSAAPAMCADCTIMGGQNVKPSFWPY